MSSRLRLAGGRGRNYDTAIVLYLHGRPSAKRRAAPGRRRECKPVEAAEPARVCLRVGLHKAEGVLDATSSGATVAARLPLADRLRKVESILLIKHNLPLDPSVAVPRDARPGEILYWVQKGLVLVCVGREIHPLDPSGRFIRLGELKGRWRAALGHVNGATEVVLERI